MKKFKVDKIIRILTFFLAFISFVFFACSPPVGYEFNMVFPKESDKLIFSDDNISVLFNLTPRIAFEGSGFSTHKFIAYEGIGLVLYNKTDKSIEIDWNRVSIKDYEGYSGNLVMHKDIKYTDCANYKTPTIIPPKSKINDIIVPCYAIELEAKEHWIEWNLSMLPPAKENSHVDFGLFLPIKIDNQIYDYNFEFQGNKVIVKNLNNQNYFKSSLNN